MAENENTHRDSLSHSSDDEKDIYYLMDGEELNILMNKRFGQDMEPIQEPDSVLPNANYYD